MLSTFSMRVKNLKVTLFEKKSFYNSFLKCIIDIKLSYKLFIKASMYNNVIFILNKETLCYPYLNYFSS